MEALFTPFAGEDAGRLAKGLVGRFGGLSRAMGATLDAVDLAEGEREALRIVNAARDMVLAACAETISGSPVDPHDAALRDYLRLQLSFSGEEDVIVIFVDTKGGYAGEEIVARGGRSSSSLPVRRIARRALDLGAGSILLAHNHPSGSELPSRQDYEVTNALVAALEAVEIAFLDHLVVTRHAVFSMKEGRGL